MLVQKDTHTHKFDEVVVKKVLPHKKSRKTFMDKIKMRKCECGATQAYDLERIISE